MAGLHVDRHALGALALCLLALAAGCLLSASSPASVSGSATSATTRAADLDAPAAPADATFPLGGPSMARAVELAGAHWGATACGGEVALEWAVLDEGTNATASWRNPTDAWNNAGANFDCRVQFNVRAEFDWPKLCTVMAHEIGHLLGRQHTAASDDLMAPVYGRPLPICATTPDPAAPPPPPPPPVAPRAAAPTVTAGTATLRAVRRAPSVTAKARRRARCAVIRRVLARRGVATQRCSIRTLQRRHGRRTYQRS